MYVLYSIQFLHQITTVCGKSGECQRCIVSNFYIKSQPATGSQPPTAGCIVSNFYIKSQQCPSHFGASNVV